jgi:hypothetical protein
MAINTPPPRPPEFQSVVEAVRELRRIIADGPPGEGWKPPPWLTERCRNNESVAAWLCGARPFHDWLIDEAAGAVLVRLVPPDCPSYDCASLEKRNRALSKLFPDLGKPQLAALRHLKDQLSQGRLRPPIGTLQPKPLGEWLVGNPDASEQFITFLDSVINELRPPPELPWNGPDADVLERTPRLLLRYMESRETADIPEMCLSVWGKDYADLGEQALPTAISKANHFLRKQKHPRLLHKGRGEPLIRWK